MSAAAHSADDVVRQSRRRKVYRARSRCSVPLLPRSRIRRGVRFCFQTEPVRHLVAGANGFADALREGGDGLIRRPYRLRAGHDARRSHTKHSGCRALGRPQRTRPTADSGTYPGVSSRPGGRHRPDGVRGQPRGLPVPAGPEDCVAIDLDAVGTFLLPERHDDKSATDGRHSRPRRQSGGNLSKWLAWTFALATALPTASSSGIESTASSFCTASGLI